MIATSPQFFCACAGSITSKILRCPWVFELRDIWPESIVAVGAIHNRAVIKLFKALELVLYRDAAVVIALTEAFKRNLVLRGVPARKVRVVTNGIALNEWGDESGRNAREQLGLDNKFVVAYVGTHGLAHSLETMLEAAALLKREPDVFFLTIGDGAEFSRLLRISEERNLANVRMLGQVPRDLARMYLQASDISLVLLRKAELFKTVIPSKIFEAMAARNPIVLGVEGEARRVVQEAGAGVCIEPENPQQLADAVLRLKANPELRKQLGENGYRTVKERFDRRVLANEMLDIVAAVARKAE